MMHLVLLALGQLLGAALLGLALAKVRTWQLALPAGSAGCFILVPPMRPVLAFLVFAGLLVLLLVLVWIVVPTRLRWSCARAWIWWRGWPAAVHRYGLRQVGNLEPDPGNEGQLIGLYAIPAGLVGPAPAAIFLGRNGTPHSRTGHREVVAIPVPPRLAGPVDAAAWIAHSHPTDYAAITHRT